MRWEISERRSEDASSDLGSPIADLLNVPALAPV
jgi:hypothetical protein